MTSKVRSLLRGPEFDTGFMRYALEIASLASGRGEVPVGAVLVHEGAIIAESSNEVILTGDPTAHAEMILLQRGARLVGRHGLAECTLYVTLEPCVMCAGAIFWARPAKVIFAASDPKRGFSQLGKNILHPATILEKGLMADESSALLKEFFQKLR